MIYRLVFSQGSKNVPARSKVCIAACVCFKMRYETDYAAHLLWWKSPYIPLARRLTPGQSRSASEQTLWSAFSNKLRRHRRCERAFSLHTGWKHTFAMLSGLRFCQESFANSTNSLQRQLDKGSTNTLKDTWVPPPDNEFRDFSFIPGEKKREVATSNIHSEGIRNCKLYILLLCI